MDDKYGLKELQGYAVAELLIDIDRVCRENGNIVIVCTVEPYWALLDTRALFHGMMMSTS
jgi:hypothetical protein